MNKLQKFFGIILLIMAPVFLPGCGMYNSLVSLDEGVKEAWSQVETQLQRRYDLIPNYVETVKGYAAQEKLGINDGMKLRMLFEQNKKYLLYHREIYSADRWQDAL
jgi:LemA protein